MKILDHTIKPSSGQHWDVLDGLRGLAILMVVVSHSVYANPNGPVWTLWVKDFLGAGAIGVQMFFVLSGFLISYPILKAKQCDLDTWYQAGYFTRRCLKIFPPFVLCVMFLGCLFALEDGNLGRFKTGLLWLVAMPHFFYIEDAYLFNGSFWSLWVEIGFYAILPLCFLLFRGRGIMVTAIIISLLLLTGGLGASWMTWLHTPLPGHYGMYLNARFPNGLANFSWGVLFAGLIVTTTEKQQVILNRVRVGYVGFLLLLFTIFVQTSLTRSGNPSEWFCQKAILCLSGISTFLMLGFLLTPQAIGARIFSNYFLRCIGIISYEWFLLHQPISLMFRRYFGSSHGSLMDYLLITVTPNIITLILAFIIYKFVSEPLLILGKSQLKKGDLPNLISLDRQA